MSASKRLVVIGDGISSNLFLYHLSLINPNYEIVQISDEKLFPSCTRFSTASVSLSGIRAIEGTLGPLLVDSFNSFCKFIKEHAPDGVYKAQHIVIAHDEQKVIDRYGHVNPISQVGELELTQEFSGVSLDGFLIDPYGLISFLKNSYKSKFTDYNEIKSAVTKRISEDTLELRNGSHISSDEFFWGIGAWRRHQPKSLLPKELHSSKMTPGSYLQWDRVQLGDQSFFCSLGHMNLLYRSADQTLMLGGTTESEHVWSTDYNELLEKYELFKSYLKVVLPDFHLGVTLKGPREKGSGRRPYYSVSTSGQVTELQIGGLYRNGFTYPFELIPQLISEWQGRNTL